MIPLEVPPTRLKILLNFALFFSNFLHIYLIIDFFITKNLHLLNSKYQELKYISEHCGSPFDRKKLNLWVLFVRESLITF